MDRERKVELAELAVKARERAYVPYSHFSVGAALLTEQGEIFTGCNIENSSFPAGNCAERTAIFSAVAAGFQKFDAIAISGGAVGKDPADYCYPCGICLQVMSEFCDPDFEILIVKNPDEIRSFRLKEMMPYTFDSLGKPD